MQNRYTILVIDDEEMICNLAKRILVRSGYDVIVATSGREGLDLFAMQTEPIALVLLDMYMDDMSGIETLRLIRETAPDMPCIFSSGQVFEKEDLPSGLQDGVLFLEKPYRSSDLSHMVSTMLSAVADSV